MVDGYLPKAFHNRPVIFVLARLKFDGACCKYEKIHDFYRNRLFCLAFMPEPGSDRHGQRRN